MILGDQVLLPGLVHHPANGIDVQRRGIRRVAVLTQRGHQRGDMPRLQLMPGEFINRHIFGAQAVCRFLQDIAHGLAAGGGKSLKVKRHRGLHRV